jgi:heme-degrading monooxygenase HmoA
VVPRPRAIRAAPDIVAQRGEGRDDVAPTMFHCTILFALKPGIALDRVRAAREGLQALIETMPGVNYLSVAHNVAADRQGFNLALFSAFESENACDIFFRHPEYHHVWREDLEPLVERQLVAKGCAEPH